MNRARADASQRAERDVVRYKYAMKAAEERLARQTAVLRELQLELVAIRVHGRLLRFEYFHDFIGLDAVLDEEGRIDSRKLELRLQDLVRRRPELGVSALNV